LTLRERGAVFDVIVSDIEMPGMDGFAFARAVRDGGAWAGLPMVALSGRADAGALSEARAAGFTDFVAKYDREALVESVRACLAVPVAA
jgi:two-component system chemotaxis sensor kinase CheA